MAQTIRQFLSKELSKNGLFDNEAEKVLLVFKEQPQAISIRLDDDIDVYPRFMLPVLVMSIHNAALNWMDKECPEHWARPIFDALTSV